MAKWITLGDATIWPIDVGDDVQWRLRYGEPSRSDLLVAADVMSAYHALAFSFKAEVATRKLRMLRRGATALVTQADEVAKP